jgi:hypothetical protein
VLVAIDKFLDKNAADDAMKQNLIDNFEVFPCYGPPAALQVRLVGKEIVGRPMASISTDWKLTSALVVVDQQSTARVLGLKKKATHEFFQGGGYKSWMTRHRPDSNAVDIAYGQIKYARVYSNVADAIDLLHVERAVARRLEFFIAVPSQLDLARTVIVERLKNGGYKIWLKSDENWNDDPSSCELMTRAMTFLNSKCSCYSPGVIDGLNSTFVFTRGMFERRNDRFLQYQLNGEAVYNEFFDSGLQFPRGLVFFFDSHTAQQIVELCDRLCDLFESPATDILLFDCPAAKDPKNPLPPPEGAWNCGIWGSYKKGFDVFKRPKHPIDGSVRYPIWQRDSEDFKKQLWQVDIVHTATESFFDVQTSEGPEYLQQFLDENKLQGKIWEGDFSERWNFPMPKQEETPREDASQNRAFLNSFSPELRMSSLDQSQIETAEGWVQILKERSNIELDYTADSLRVLDDYITKYFPEGCMFDTTIQSVASYIGEVLRRECGAEWVMSEMYPPGVAVDGLFANVHGWTENRFDPKQTDTLVEKYDRYRAEMEKRKGTQLPT